MAFFVYTIYSESYDRFYIGQTQEFNTRLQRHNSGLEKFTSPYLPWTAMCIIEKTTRSAAMLPERKLKNLNRVKLTRFIAKYGNIGPRRGFAGLGADL
ncbi:MAG: GIY-YIG nuclease family protein [Chitinophagaceae bacterium]